MAPSVVVEQRDGVSPGYHGTPPKISLPIGFGELPLVIPHRSAVPLRGLRTDPEAKPRAVAAPRPTGPVDDDLGRVRVENRSISGQSRRV